MLVEQLTGFRESKPQMKFTKTSVVFPIIRIHTFYWKVWLQSDIVADFSQP